MIDKENPARMSTHAAPTWADLLERAATSTHSGPAWSHESEDLDVTLLSWEAGHRIAAHANNEVDVVIIGIEGSGVVEVDEVAHAMAPGVVLLIPQGCERAIESTSARFSYLSVHKRRRGLMPTIGGLALT